MTAHPSPSVSVCIPYHGKSPAVLHRSVASALSALPTDGEVLVAADGVDATAGTETADLPPVVQIVGSAERLGLVGNWNRCLDNATGRLIHLLHDDDGVTPGFYGAVLDLEAQFPSAGLLVTGFSHLGDPGADDGLSRPAPVLRAAEPVLLTGAAASSFLLRQGRHVCGSVVLTRRAVYEAGPFDPAFAYCPDEEAYFRYAACGGIAFDDRPLYLERIHAGQERFRTWLKDDFVRTYAGARVAGAGQFGAGQELLARRTTGANVTRLAVRLAGEGHADKGRHHLDELAAALPGEATGRGFRVARWTCTTRPGAHAARAAVAVGWIVLRLRRGGWRTLGRRPWRGP